MRTMGEEGQPLGPWTVDGRRERDLEAIGIGVDAMGRTPIPPRAAISAADYNITTSFTYLYLPFSSPFASSSPTTTTSTSSFPSSAVRTTFYPLRTQQSHTISAVRRIYSSLASPPELPPTHPSQRLRTALHTCLPIHLSPRASNPHSNANFSTRLPETQTPFLVFPFPPFFVLRLFFSYSGIALSHSVRG